MAAQGKIQAEPGPYCTVEEVRRLATVLRRSAREERAFFHYNGHGVPRPTANGEIWVFNRCPMVSNIMSILYVL